MRQDLRTLGQIHVAKNCPASWDDMKGDERVRHCSLCRLNVYNLSEMDGKAALALVQKSEGRICVRFYRREDGTMITRDCPKGLKAFRQRAAKRLVLACSMVLSAVGCGSTAERLKADFGIAPTPPPPISVYAGDMIVLPPKPLGTPKTTPVPLTKPKTKAKQG